MAPGSGMSVYGMVKCAADKPPKPIPGGIYCKCHPSASCAFCWRQKLRVRFANRRPDGQATGDVPAAQPGRQADALQMRQPEPDLPLPGALPAPAPAATRRGQLQLHVGIRPDSRGRQLRLRAWRAQGDDAHRRGGGGGRGPVRRLVKPASQRRALVCTPAAYIDGPYTLARHQPSQPSS